MQTATYDNRNKQLRKTKKQSVQKPNDKPNQNKPKITKIKHRRNTASILWDSSQVTHHRRFIFRFGFYCFVSFLFFVVVVLLFGELALAVLAGIQQCFNQQSNKLFCFFGTGVSVQMYSYWLIWHNDQIQYANSAKPMESNLLGNRVHWHSNSIVKKILIKNLNYLYCIAFTAEMQWKCARIEW